MPTNSSALSVISSHLEKFASCPAQKSNGGSSRLKSLSTGGGELDLNLAANAKLVLMTKIEFHKAESATSTAFNDSLKAKYITLSPNTPQMNGTVPKVSPVHSASDICDRPSTSVSTPKRVLYPPERIKLTWCRPVPVGAGLINCGNTCFLNSTLQALTHTAPLYNYLVSEQHVQNCRTAGFCMLCEMERLMVRCYGSTNRAIEPESILRKLSVIAKHLRLGRQEDAHEFLRFAVDKMQQACLGQVGAKVEAELRETTAMNAIFGGSIKSTVICSSCRVHSDKIDPIMDVCLELKHASTLSQALEHFIKPETLAGENSYKCLSCKKPQPARKMLSIHKAPVVLTCQLKRFGAGFALFGGAKITKSVEFYERLNLRPFMTNKNGPDIPYNLYAVVVHEGLSANSGHYYAYVKHNQQWFIMNDSIVKTVSVRQVLSCQAYLLFYIRDLDHESSTAMRTPVKQVGKLPTASHSASKLVTPPNSVVRPAPQSAPAPIKMVIRLPPTTTAAPPKAAAVPTVAKRPTESASPPPVSKVTATRPLVEMTPSASSDDDDDDNRLVIDEHAVGGVSSSAMVFSRPEADRDPPVIKFVPENRSSVALSTDTSLKKDSDAEDGEVSLDVESTSTSTSRKKKRKHRHHDDDHHHRKHRRKHRHDDSESGKKKHRRKHRHRDGADDEDEDDDDEQWVEKHIEPQAPLEKEAEPIVPPPPSYVNGHDGSFSLGRHVASWDGGLNSIDAQTLQNGAAEHMSNGERWKREFDAELDAGRAKKAKFAPKAEFETQLPANYPHRPTYSTGNAFQAVQNARMQEHRGNETRRSSGTSSPIDSPDMSNGFSNGHQQAHYATAYNSGQPPQSNSHGHFPQQHHESEHHTLSGYTGHHRHHNGHHQPNGHTSNYNGNSGNYADGNGYQQHSSGQSHGNHNEKFSRNPQNGGGFVRKGDFRPSHHRYPASAPRMYSNGNQGGYNGNWRNSGYGAGRGGGRDNNFRRQFSLPYQQ